MRAAAIVAWLYFALWLEDLVNPGPAGLALIIISGVAVGVIVNRWWSPLVLFALAVGASIWAYASQTETQEVWWGYFALFALGVAAGLSLLLLGGTGLRRLWDGPTE